MGRRVSEGRWLSEGSADWGLLPEINGADVAEMTSLAVQPESSYAPPLGCKLWDQEGSS